MRHRVSSKGWFNLGYIIDKSAKQTIPRSKQAKLPNGVRSIRVALLQSLPSTTILVCQFYFDDELSELIEKQLKKIYKEYKEKKGSITEFFGVEQQKKNNLQLHQEFLADLCSSWVSNHFKGLYSSNLVNEKHPICTFLTLEQDIPFKKNKDEKYNNYKCMLGLCNDYDVWECEELNGLYLQEQKKKFPTRQSLVLSGNINKLSENENLSHYDSTKENKVLNFLFFLDNTFEKWILMVILKSYEYQITDLRDKYGDVDLSSTNNPITTISELDHKILDVQKNILPFIVELQNYSKNKKYFLNEINEFTRLRKDCICKKKFFESIRLNILHHIKILKRDIKVLKNTSNSIRQVSNIISSNKVSKTNIDMQGSIRKLTWIMLFLTFISTISTVLALLGEEKIKTIKTEIVQWYSAYSTEKHNKP